MIVNTLLTKLQEPGELEMMLAELSVQAPSVITIPLGIVTISLESVETECGRIMSNL